jgi:nicotinamide mononucleotide transporter PnuC
MVVVVVSNVATKDVNALTLLDTLIGVTALIFVAKGDVFGQVLTVAFSILYAVTSYQCHYYGEMFTYLGMTMPIAIVSIVTWVKHPYNGNSTEVQISKLTKWQKLRMVLLAIVVAFVFYWILKAFDTPNLEFSTASIITSFCASYLMMCRSSYYALAYALNDIVLIVLWGLATLQNITYLSMVSCFVIFLLNDVYGYFSWKVREVHQNL